MMRARAEDGSGEQKSPQLEERRPTRGYSWEPFTAGHTLSMQHGATSPRVMDPLANSLVEALLADDTVAYLREPSYRWSVDAWGRAEAKVLLLSSFIERLDGVEAAMTDVSEEETDETRFEGGSSRRVTTAKRRESAMAQLERAEKFAAMCRTRLGLDPLARARLGRDVVSAQVDMAELLSRMHEDQQAAEQQQGGAQ